eukprot:SAG31_NODE_642_length_13301_cov_14.143084_14_plen_87_part_00
MLNFFFKKKMCLDTNLDPADEETGAQQLASEVTAHCSLTLVVTAHCTLALAHALPLALPGQVTGRFSDLRGVTGRLLAGDAVTVVA